MIVFPIKVYLLEVNKAENTIKQRRKFIFIDQIIIGSYGLSSIEAMAYGKPSMCYILDEVFENGLDRDCPIVNVNPDTFEEALINLLKSPNLRHSIGIKSRQFVEKYHDTLKICEQILNQI